MPWAMLLWLACAEHPVGIGPGERVPEDAGLPELGAEALSGRPSVIFFWASWSGAARQQAAGLPAWAGAARVLAVNLGEDPHFAGHAEGTWLSGAQHLRDRAGMAREVWAVEAVPTVILVDSEAVVRSRGTVLPSPEGFAWEAP